MLRAPSTRSAAARAAALAPVVLLVLAALAPAAAAKPKVAILGLEVVGNLDPEQARLAKQLTAGLRERASAGTGPYQLAPNSDKELVDEKLMNNCGNEAVTCMAPIGINLGADFLMYGHIEKVDRGYHVTIKLLRVASKTPMPTVSEIVPAAELKSDLKGVAKRWYARVTASEEGSVTIRIANADRATVYVDDEPVGTTTSGMLTFPVPAGRHRIAVVPTEKGLRRHEQTLVVNAGDARNLPIELAPVGRDGRDGRDGRGGGSAGGGDDEGAGPSSVSAELRRERTGAVSESDSNPWRNRAIGGLVLTVVAGGAFGASWGILARDTTKGDGFFEYTCNTDDPARKDKFGCKNGDALVVSAYVSGGLTAAFAVFTGFAFYKSATRRETPANAGRSARPRRQLLVTPVMSPTGGGATLRLDW